MGRVHGAAIRYTAAFLTSLAVVEVRLEGKTLRRVSVNMARRTHVFIAVWIHDIYDLMTTPYFLFSLTPST